VTTPAPETTRAIYVRMSERLARKLDKAAERLGASKRDVLSSLVNDHLNTDGDNLVFRLRSSPAAGRVDADAYPEREILTLDEAAAMLRVPAADVIALAEAGDVPARRVGDQWRFARRAILSWLGAAQ
jgi:excisionase family DNA binding protein